MGKKRKRAEENDEIDVSKELKRLKKEMRRQKDKIRRLKKKSKRSSSEESDSSLYSRQRTPLIPIDQLQSSRNDSGEIPNLEIDKPETEEPPQIPVDKNQEDVRASVETEDSSKGLKTSEADKDPVLDEKLLQAIGKCLDAEKIFAPAIHNDLLVRWKGVLKEGLPKEEREEIFKKYPVPENCLSMEPPKLNPEVKASLLEPIITRDNRMVEKQREVSLCLAALGPLISNLLKGFVPDSMSLLIILSDISRILVDLQREESKTRRLIILANLNAAMKDTLNATNLDEWLFGKDLEETLKAAKSLERSSKELKPGEKTSTQNSKNSRGPNRQATRGRGASVTGQHKPAYQSYNNQKYKQKTSNYYKASTRGRANYYKK